MIKIDRKVVSLLDNALGLWVIPEDWKQRVYSFLLALLALIDMFADVPDQYQDPVTVATVATAIATILALALKKARVANEK